MALGRGTAAAVVAAVAADPGCREVIDSALGRIAGRFGWAGGLRNLGFIAQNAATLLGASYGASLMAQGGRPVEGGRFFNEVQKETGTLFSLNTTDEQARLVCTGIAATTAAAINKALRTAKPGSSLALVARADSHDRQGTTTAHTATGIWMRDKSFHVFDWHATLQSDNPMLYASDAAFSAGDGVLFAVFNGFR
ncbi:hypothetical protein GCM10010964_11300 [Caldovatus sediminis]|uniref:Uncharacterized protein n=1 Tax=Caldovatus sediminis TaxID=2041189 RepID=A0A8J3EBM4_9PROT|nr:hypothetical protein [Caldovatus sediminis]GGG25016.1 hypothetical protein GCM10010964_11300 [Caldovatus sediminis]